MTQDITALDRAHSKMAADLEDNAARLGFYGALADAELFILLTIEAAGDAISPEILDLEGDKYVLVFDSEERFAQFTTTPAPYAALPGRVIAGMLTGQKIGMGLNLGVAPSSIVIPYAAMDWLTEALSINPELQSQQALGRTNQGLGTFSPASETTVRLAPILTEKLRFSAGLVSAVILANLHNTDNSETAVLGFLGAPDTAHPGLARMAQEALVFAGLEGHPLDVLFLQSESPQAKRMIKVGTEIRLPKVQIPVTKTEIIAPGSDPTKPPILR